MFMRSFNGGTLTGKVSLNGTPPPTRIFHLIFSPNIDFCTKISDGKGNRLLKAFRSYFTLRHSCPKPSPVLDREQRSGGMAVGNPCFAVTGPDGSFSIPDLPPETYDVIAWHPHMKVKSERITVSAHGKAELNFEFDSAEVHIPLYDLQTRYRLENALDLLHLKPPTVELQVP